MNNRMNYSFATTAPPFPSYLTVQYSTFFTPKPLALLKQDLDEAFEACNIKTSPSEEGDPCGWDCIATTCFFRVCIFTASDGNHQVEISRLYGSHIGFMDVIDKLSGHLKIQIPGGNAARWRPPPMP